MFKSLQIYDSYSLSVVCMPTSAVIQAQISSALGSNSDQISSLQNGYKMILIAIPIAIVLSILFLLIIRFTAGIFIYLLIFFSIAALGAFGGYLLAANPATASSTTITILANRPACIAIGVVCIVLSVLLLVMFICFRKRVSLASSIIKVSAKFVDSELGILLLPLILFVVMLFFVLLWIL